MRESVCVLCGHLGPKCWRESKSDEQSAVRFDLKFELCKPNTAQVHGHTCLLSARHTHTHTHTHTHGARTCTCACADDPHIADARWWLSQYHNPQSKTPYTWAPNTSLVFHPSRLETLHSRTAANRTVKPRCSPCTLITDQCSCIADWRPRLVDATFEHAAISAWVAFLAWMRPEASRRG